MAAKLLCPICKNPVETTEPEYPFCSQRCRTIDLANWSTEKYTIHTPLFDPEKFGEAEAASEPEEGDEGTPRGKPN